MRLPNSIVIRSLALFSPALFSLAVLAASPSQGAPPSAGAQEGPSLSKETKSKIGASIDRGLHFLRDRQTPAGIWQIQGHDDPGTTALAITTFLNSPRDYASDDGPFIRNPLEYLASLAKEDGGIYDRALSNYVTSVAVMALDAAGEERYRPLVEKARSFLVTLQSDEGEGYRPEEKFYGGAGYGGDERPDLSNMSFWIEAARASGVKPEDEAIKKALRFLDRCQNHSETNKESWKNPKTGEVYVSGDDGGGIYAPGSSNAGYDKLEDGRLVARSYGSMSYALLKCYLFAGVPADDARVVAVKRWISENMDFEHNPGFDTAKDPASGYQGLYYYYYTAARALDLAGVENFVDASGASHPWREELAARILSLQREDGSWLNDKNGRWWEGEPLIATSYALLALESCLGLK